MSAESQGSIPANTSAQQWLQVTLASIGDGVITIDADAKVTFLNPVAEKLTGWPNHEARGLPLESVFKIIDEDSRTEVENPAIRALREGVVFGLANHTILLNREGNEIAIDDSGAPIKIADSSHGAILVFRDVGERRQGERARALLAGIVNSSDDAIVSKTLDGIITSWNAAAERMFGYTSEEAVGKSITLIIPKDRLDEETKILSKLRRGERIEHFDTIRVTKDGTLKNISLTVSPLRDSMGNITGASKVARDITDRVRAEEERTRLLASETAARMKAETASRAKDEFLAMISHEIRTPLNAILGWSQLLEQGKLDQDSIKRATATISRNARMQVKLLSDLLEISRVITGKLKLNTRPVDVRTSLDAAIESVRSGAEAKSISILVSQKDEHAVVTADADRLQQVFWNLLSNAVKFTPTGGRISVVVSRSGSGFTIQVKDAGIGIKSEFLPYVFDRFSQADLSSTREYGGLGLGLAIVRHLVELHGGSVHAASKGENKGATFTVTLPIGALKEAASPDIANLNLEGVTEFAEEFTLKGLKILIVDDEPEARELLSAMLQLRGAEVQTCCSAAESLPLIESWQPSVLVSDISMPVEDGYSLIRKIRRTASVQKLPAVALTAYARPQDRMRALAAGFNMHVSKPVEAGELVMVIASLCDRAVTQ
jgi:PAS domain S-box-containing protein